MTVGELVSILDEYDVDAEVRFEGCERDGDCKVGDVVDHGEYVCII